MTFNRNGNRCQDTTSDWIRGFNFRCRCKTSSPPEPSALGTTEDRTITLIGSMKPAHGYLRPRSGTDKFFNLVHKDRLQPLRIEQRLVQSRSFMRKLFAPRRV